LYGPNGTRVYTAYAVAENSAVQFTYKVPENAKMGTYLIKVYNKDIPTALKYVVI
jgi:uncharacterized protein YfaS (alpha-2-macroglobulin family)